MLLIFVHALYIDVIGVIAIVMNIWSDSHASSYNSVIVGVHCLCLSALRSIAHY